ncbi:DUF7550 family protein [Halogeometricum limi]|uniref:Uncharacterized protein n=1 Tax=Halogeometricum limi TaxID=555875 RepID=A0A1I6GUZ6_9EURY|nr:hypothetical protein [Halogeometricum limi]SFR46032.1 hypothetical protein SAMN04488124_1569 [Halogeometricum limi]
MSDETYENPSDQYESDHTVEGHAANEHDEYEGAHHSSDPGRVTSPMQEFSTGKAMTGLVVLAVGLAVIFGLPLVL